MKCPNCSFNNIASAKECKICGTKLEPVEGANNDTLALDEALKAIFAVKIKNDEILTDSIPRVEEAEEEEAETAWEPLSEETDAGAEHGDTQPMSRLGMKPTSSFEHHEETEAEEAHGGQDQGKQGLFINPLLDAPNEEEEEEAPSRTPAFIPVYERTDESIRIEDKAENLMALPSDPVDELQNIPARRRRSKADEIAAIALVVLIICLAALIYVAIKMAKSPEEPPVIISEQTTTSTSTNFAVQVDVRDFLSKLESYLKNGSETAALKFFLNPVKANDVLKPIRDLQPVSIRFDRIEQDDTALRFEAEIENIDQEIRYRRTVRFQVTFADRSNDMDAVAHDFDPETDGALRQEIGQVPTTETTSSEEETTVTTTTERIPFDESYFTKSGSLSGGSGTTADTLRKVRMGDHLYFHRFVFDFLGDRAPVYTVSLLDGGLALQVQVANITDFTTDYALAEWSYLAKSIQITADTPNSILIQITMNEPVMMYTYTLDEPGRIVIDIRGESSED